jgi:hypothetical protein
MNLLVSCISKQFVMEHNILPGDCFIKLKLDLVYFVLRLHMNKEVGMIENCIHQKIGAFFYVVYFTSRRLYKLILGDSSLSFFE